MSNLPLDKARCDGGKCPSKTNCRRFTERKTMGETAPYAALDLRREAGASACDLWIPINVNSTCAGIATESLEVGGPGSILSLGVEELRRGNAAEKQRDKLLAAAEAIEIDAEECLDFDECTAILVPIDTYHKLMEAIASARGAA